MRSPIIATIKETYKNVRFVKEDSKEKKRIYCAEKDDPEGYPLPIYITLQYDEDFKYIRSTELSFWREGFGTTFYPESSMSPETVVSEAIKQYEKEIESDIEVIYDGSATVIKKSGNVIHSFPFEVLFVKYDDRKNTTKFKFEDFALVFDRFVNYHDAKAPVASCFIDNSWITS